MGDKGGRRKITPPEEYYPEDSPRRKPKYYTGIPGYEY